MSSNQPARPSAKNSEPRPAAASSGPPKRNIAILVGIAVVMTALCVLPLGALGIAYLAGGSNPPTKPEPMAKQEPKEEEAAPVITPVIAPPSVAPVPPHIQAAIDKGAGHLKKRLLESGGRYSVDNRYPADASVGGMALAGVALLEANVPPSDPAIQKVLAKVREGAPTLRLVYALGATIFFLNRLHEASLLAEDDRQLVRTLALRMINGQLADGRWTYVNPAISVERENELLAKLANNEVTAQARAGSATNSMTQFALLAIWGSRRHDIPARPVFLKAAAHFHRTQSKDGTWGYDAGKTFGTKHRIDSNTCAGLIALAIERTVNEEPGQRARAAPDPEAASKSDEQCQRAFAHLASVVGRPPLPAAKSRPDAGNTIRASALGDYYFLWSLERVAVIYDLKTIGGKDWYEWGSDIIVKNQRPDGSWLDRHGDVCDTCFAMLFLTRANLAKDLTQSIRARRAN